MDKNFKDDIKKIMLSITSPKFQNDIINAIYQTSLNIIKNEIHQSKYISLILDESTDRTTTSLLTVNIIYFWKNQVRERFIYFIDVSNNRSGQDIYEIIIQYDKLFNF